MFKEIMNPAPYQRKKTWMMQEHLRLNSLLLLAVNKGPPGMLYQVVPPLKGARTWEVLVKLGEMMQMVVSHADRIACRGVISLGN
jgi:hypothetical protein